MRERVTFVQKLGDGVDPASLKISGTGIKGPDITAARENRLTVALSELPRELQGILEESHELHIRWISPLQHKSVSPFLSRLAPGFHLFYTPRGEATKDSSKLCTALAKAFGDIGCVSPARSFSSLPNDRFSHSSALQFFQPLESLDHFVAYAKELLCYSSDASCRGQVDSLALASSLDISYDTISHALKLTALSPYQAQNVDVQSSSQHRTEVGILASDKPPNLEPFELGISGHLTVLGQDSNPSPTLFSFPSRHRDAESGFSTTFLTPTGLHPTLQIRLESNMPPSEAISCSAHAYFTLPRGIFADKYQLADELFLASKNLKALRYTSQPVDLEAPEYLMSLWGSAILLQLSPPDSVEPQPWTAEIPLHLRYLSPAQGGYQNIEIPTPAVFWACPAEDGTKFPTNPFDRVNLGYDGLFGPRTVFWHLEPHAMEGNRLVNTVTVPVLDLARSRWANIGTALAVLLGFAWVSWKLLAVYSRQGYGRNTPQESKAKAAKKKQ